MDRTEFYTRLTASRKIASIKDERLLEKALTADVGSVVLSVGNVGNIARYVQLYKAQGIPVFVHAERIGGMSQDKEGVAFLARCVKPDGIVTTRHSLIKQAKKQGLLTVQRFFLVDSDAMTAILQSVRETEPDAVEIMPALLPAFIAEFSQTALRPCYCRRLAVKPQANERSAAAWCHRRVYGKSSFMEGEDDT